MKYAVAALLSTASAVKIHAAPDVYGPNGENYQNDNAVYDLSRIGISISSRGSGDLCSEGDQVAMHQVGTLIDGRMVTDSHAEGDGMPKIFQVGAHQVFKCWDLALPQLHIGDKATITCPSHYVWGGAYVQSPLGGEPVPLHSDMRFEVEVLTCTKSADVLNAKMKEQIKALPPPAPHVPATLPPVPENEYEPPTTRPVFTPTVTPFRCFYLHSRQSEDLGVEQVLSYRQDGDKISLIVEPKVAGTPEQQWQLSSIYRNFFSPASPYPLSIDSANGQKGLTLHKRVYDYNSQEGWRYTSEGQFLDQNDLPLTINHDDNTVKTAGNFQEHNQYWNVEYCQDN